MIIRRHFRDVPENIDDETELVLGKSYNRYKSSTADLAFITTASKRDIIWHTWTMNCYRHCLLRPNRLFHILGRHRQKPVDLNATVLHFKDATTQIYTPDGSPSFSPQAWTITDEPRDDSGNRVVEQDRSMTTFIRLATSERTRAWLRYYSPTSANFKR